MARQTIELGVIPDGAGGDTDRQAHDKSNSNATEIYNFLGDGTNLVPETARQNIGALGEDDVYSMPEIDNFLSKKADLVSGLVPSSQLPSYVDDVIESDNFASLPATGEQGKIYVTIDNNKIYRWSGTAYIEIVGGAGGVADSALKLQTARNINDIPFDGTQDITIPKANIGLGNVDNTSDLNKPISTATQTALDAKADLDPVKRGIGNTYDSSLSYNINDRVLLDDGTEVISTIASNTNDPNVDMTGWLKKGNQIDVYLISDLLAINNPKDGDVAHVSSYLTPNFALSTPYLGGGVFKYKADLSSVNNGVTILNGWIRLNQSELSTYDAGLVGQISIDGDATTKLNNLASAAPANTKISILGDFVVSSNVRFKNVSGVEVTGGGSITGDAENWTFGENLQSGTTAYGIIIFDTCPDARINNLKITGVQKNVFGSFQAGDAGIQLFASPRSKIQDCDVSHTFAWGVLSESGDYVEANNNVISDVAHQSGISLNHGGSKYTKSNFNTIYNVGLYGIEVEDQTVFNENKMFEAFGNVIFDCTYGIVTTGNGLCRGVIAGNYLLKNGTALWNVNSNAVLNLAVNSNTCINNYKSIIMQATPNMDVKSNTFNGFAKSVTYYKTSPDALILKLIDANSFMMKKGIRTDTGLVYINDQEYNITSITDYTDPTLEFSDDNGSPAAMVKVTLAEAVSSAMVNKILCRKALTGSYGEAVVSITSGSGGSTLSQNKIDGGLYLLFCNADISGTEPQVVIEKNSFEDYSINAILHINATTHVKYKGNSYSKMDLTAFNIPDALITNGYFRTKSVKFLQAIKAKTSGSGIELINFGHFISDSIQWMFVFSESATGTGDVQVGINNTTVLGAVDGTINTGMFVKYSASLVKGKNVFRITNTTNNLAYSDLTVDFLQPS